MDFTGIEDLWIGGIDVNVDVVCSVVNSPESSI